MPVWQALRLGQPSRASARKRSRYAAGAAWRGLRRGERRPRMVSCIRRGGEPDGLEADRPRAERHEIRRRCHVYEPSGSWVAIATPFKEDESVNFDVFEQIVNFHAENGTS